MWRDRHHSRGFTELQTCLPGIKILRLLSNTPGDLRWVQARVRGPAPGDQGQGVLLQLLLLDEVEREGAPRQQPGQRQQRHQGRPQLPARQALDAGAPACVRAWVRVCTLYNMACCSLRPVAACGAAWCCVSTFQVLARSGVHMRGWQSDMHACCLPAAPGAWILRSGPQQPARGTCAALRPSAWACC